MHTGDDSALSTKDAPGFSSDKRRTAKFEELSSMQKPFFTLCHWFLNFLHLRFHTDQVRTEFLVLRMG